MAQYTFNGNFKETKMIITPGIKIEVTMVGNERKEKADLFSHNINAFKVIENKRFIGKVRKKNIYNNKEYITYAWAIL